MITDDERFIKIQGILALSDIHPNDCIKINDLIIDLSKQKDYLQNQVEKLTQENEHLKNIINVYENPNDVTKMFMYCDEITQDTINKLNELNELRSKE